MRIEDFKVRPGGEASTTAEVAGGFQAGLGTSGTDSTRPGPLDPYSILRSLTSVIEPWVLPIDHWSATQQNMFEICPEQYRNRYILGRKEAPGQALVLGQVAHGGIEFGLDVKMVTQNEPELGVMIEYYHDAVWPQMLERHGGEDEIVWDDKPEQVRKKGVELVTVYHPRIVTCEPEAIEHEFRLDLDLPVPVVGFIDVVQQGNRPLIDLKTSSKKRPAMKPDWRVQGRLYKLAIPRTFSIHQITTGSNPEVITPLENEEMTEPYSELIAHETRVQITQALAEANRLYSLHGPDEPWPTRGIYHDWRCSPKWCAYRADCPAWKEEE